MEKIKNLKKWEIGPYKDAYRFDLKKTNRIRILIFSSIIIIVFLLLMILIDIPNYKKSLFKIPDFTNGYFITAAGRFLVFVFSILALLVSILVDEEKTGQETTTALQKLSFIAVFLSLIINTFGEYILYNDIQTYTESVLAFSIIILFPDMFAFMFFFCGFILMAAFVILFNNDSSLVVSNLSDITTVSFLSYIFSRVNYYMHLSLFKFKTIITEQNSKLEELAAYDQLTEIYNRRKFDEFLTAEMKRSNRYKHKFSLIIFDIDHFKRINDTYGHNTGDIVLREISSIVKNNLRTTDSVARWGGEEFAVIASETFFPNAVSLAEKLRKLIADYNFPQAGKVTSSFGVTEYIFFETKEDLIQRTDKALYKAKNNGRNRVESL